MAAIQIRVGAALDRSTMTVFQQLAEQAKRANRQIADEARKASKEEEKAWKDAQRELARMEREATNERKKAQKASTDAAKAAAKEEERIARDKVQAMIRIDRELTRSREREAKERARAEERAADDAARAWVKSEEKRRRDLARGRSQTIKAAGQLGYSALMSAGRFGASVLSDMAAGAGVRFDMGSHFANASDLEERAAQLSNSGYMPGANGANGQRVDPRELMAQAYQVGNSTGTAANEVMGGLQAFVGKTGDLESARSVIGDLAKISKATGANFADMADAAADVSNQLGDIPDKGARIKDVMMTIAGQGKIGAVEIKDLASQMAKVANYSNLMEGDAGKNIALFGAIAQESRAKGGSASATQAATSVSSLMDTFSKGARLDAFKGLGVRTTGEGGKTRNIEEIIIESLQKTQRGGNADLTNKLFGSLFATAQSRRAVRGFESTFRGAYAHAGGTEEEKLAIATKAVREEFTRLQDVAMSHVELEESFAEAMKTGKSQAETFNNQLQEIAQDAQTQLMPALIALAPPIIKLTKAASDAAVALFGLKKSPSDALDPVTGAVHKGNRSVAALLEHPESMTEEDYAKAKKLLLANKNKAANARADAKVQINEAKNGGTFVGNALTEYVGNAVDQASQGNWGSAALGLLPLTGVARAVYKTATNDTEYQRAQAGNAASGEASLREADATTRESDEQLQKLEQIHDFFQNIKGGNSINVTIVNPEALRGGKGGGGAPGAGGNKGLEPTE